MVLVLRTAHALETCESIIITFQCLSHTILPNYFVLYESLWYEPAKTPCECHSRDTLIMMPVLPSSGSDRKTQGDALKLHMHRHKQIVIKVILFFLFKFTILHIYFTLYAYQFHTKQKAAV